MTGDRTPGALTPRHHELFAELDACSKGASEALADDDWDTWSMHAARGAEILEELAVLNGWRDQ